MADDWDLFAVVRSCKTSTSTAATAEPPPPITTSSISNPARVSRNRGDPFVNLLPPFRHDAVDPFYFPGVTDERDDYSFQGLEEIYKELYLDSAAVPVPALTPSGGFQNSHHQQQQVQPRVLQPPPPPHQQNQHSPINRRGITGSSFSSANPHSTGRPRRRKNQQAKVTHHMTQEELSTDSWAWRKYGQKPIKGSPYPRNYYRCSTSKSCSARKQVERSPTDPDIFVVSYSGEHTHPRPTHRSSLAGSTRSKLPTTKPLANIPATLITSSSSPVSATSFSPAATPIVMEEEEEEEEGDSEGNQENINRGDNDNNNNNIEDDEEEEEEEDEEEEEEDILIPNCFITDDILKGFEELSGGGGDGTNIGGSDSVADNSSACSLISPPWTPTTNFTAAGGGC